MGTPARIGATTPQNYSQNYTTVSTASSRDVNKMQIIPAQPPAASPRKHPPPTHPQSHRMKLLDDPKELMDKVHELEKYRKEEVKERKAHDQARRKEMMAHKKKLTRELQACAKEVRKRESEVGKLQRTLNKNEQQQEQSLGKKMREVEKVDDALSKLKRKHDETEQQLHLSTSAAGEAKGRMAHIEFAQRMLDQGVVLDTGHVSIEKTLESLTEVKNDLAGQVDHLRTQNFRLSRENDIIRQEIEENRRIARSPQHATSSSRLCSPPRRMLSPRHHMESPIRGPLGSPGRLLQTSLHHPPSPPRTMSPVFGSREPRAASVVRQTSVPVGNTPPSSPLIRATTGPQSNMHSPGSGLAQFGAQTGGVQRMLSSPAFGGALGSVISPRGSSPIGGHFVSNPGPMVRPSSMTLLAPQRVPVTSAGSSGVVEPQPYKSTALPSTTGSFSTTNGYPSPVGMRLAPAASTTSTSASDFIASPRQQGGGTSPRLRAAVSRLRAQALREYHMREGPIENGEM